MIPIVERLCDMLRAKTEKYYDSIAENLFQRVLNSASAPTFQDINDLVVRDILCECHFYLTRDRIEMISNIAIAEIAENHDQVTALENELEEQDIYYLTNLIKIRKYLQ